MAGLKSLAAKLLGERRWRRTRRFNRPRPFCYWRRLYEENKDSYLQSLCEVPFAKALSGKRIACRLDENARYEANPCSEIKAVVLRSLPKLLTNRKTCLNLIPNFNQFAGLFPGSSKYSAPGTHMPCGA